MNPTNPEHTIELGGETYRLSYSRRDFANAEWALKRPLLGPDSADFWGSAAPSYQSDVLLFVGLQRSMPGVTLDAVQDLVTYDNAGYVQETVWAAVKDAMPRPREQEGKPDADPLAPPNGGSAPGPTLVTTSGAPSANPGS